MATATCGRTAGGPTTRSIPRTATVGGFSGEFADIGVDVIVGEPGALVGRTVAAGDQVGQIWTEGGNHNRKPTGMACVDSTLYLAIQDLALNFDDAPAASISRSDDGGQTWTWDRSGPMFFGGVFTTVIFLDYGKDYAAAPDGYVYAYGLDHNWRASFSDTVPHPVDLYLGRVPRESVQDRTSWEFYAGLTADDAPIWSRDIGRRTAVLHDARTVHHDGAGALAEHTVISQGGSRLQRPVTPLPLHLVDRVHLRVLSGAGTMGPMEGDGIQGLRAISVDAGVLRRLRHHDPIEVHQRRRPDDVVAEQRVPVRGCRGVDLRLLAAPIDAVDRPR